MPQSAFALLGEKSRKAIVRLNRLTTKHQLTFEEATLLLAVAERNFSRSSQTPLGPATVMSVANFIQLPYEPTRRKISRLTQRGLLARVGGDGYVVADLNRVRDLLHILGEPLDDVTPSGAANS